MNNCYITEINIEKSRGIENFTIPLSQTSRKHLILTGKNGSGKTSLLTEIVKYLRQTEKRKTTHYQTQKRIQGIKLNGLKNENLDEKQRNTLEQSLKDVNEFLMNFGGTKIRFSVSDDIVERYYESGKFLLAFFGAKRLTDIPTPTGIRKVDLKSRYSLEDKANSNFLQYMVNLKADKSFARDDGEVEAVERIDRWFERLTSQLRKIFDDDTLEMKFDRKNYNFNIISKISDTPFGFNTLSDGYSAIVSIVTEIIFRMESHSSEMFDLEGVVVIDEIETHLHVKLQKHILPFLIELFPNLQFIVSTHSPFVLSSTSEAIICDLERKIVTEDFTGYSYSTLIECYFDTDKYSEDIKRKVTRLESLIRMKEKTTEEQNELETLMRYIAEIPKYNSEELLAKFQQLQLLNLMK